MLQKYQDKINHMLECADQTGIDQMWNALEEAILEWAKPMKQVAARNRKESWFDEGCKNLPLIRKKND